MVYLDSVRYLIGEAISSDYLLSYHRHYLIDGILNWAQYCHISIGGIVITAVLIVTWLLVIESIRATLSYDLFYGNKSPR